MTIEGASWAPKEAHASNGFTCVGNVNSGKLLLHFMPSRSTVNLLLLSDLMGLTTALWSQGHKVDDRRVLAASTLEPLSVLGTWCECAF